MRRAGLLALFACSSPSTEPVELRDAGARLDAPVEGEASEAPSGCPVAKLYVDSDGDGFGSALVPARAVCVGAKGYVENARDCADEDDRARPDQNVPQDSTHPVRGPVNSPPPQDRIDQLDFNCDKKIECRDARGAGSPCNPYDGTPGCFCL